MRMLLLLILMSPFALAQQKPAAIPQASAASSAKQSQPIFQGSVSAAPRSSAPVPAMSPADAYLYAMQPFDNARNGVDDLTDADQWALGIGIARAKQQCDLLAKQNIRGESLLSLGKLCIFGQDFMPARDALVDYLEMPKTQSAETAHLLLARAFLGLHQIDAAESQMDSLLALYPYDASTHLAIDIVVDAAEASDDADDLAIAGRLDQQQLPHTLDALAHGGSLTGNGDSVDAAMLVRDALRCADRLRRRGQFDDAQKIVSRVETLVAVPAIAEGPDAPEIQNELTRYLLYGQLSPVREFHGEELPLAGSPVIRRIPLYDPNPAAHRTVTHEGREETIRMSDDRTLVLLFSLAGPASVPTLQAILKGLAKDHVTPGLKVIAVTSYAANIGNDTPDPQVLEYLRALRVQLPRELPVLVVPGAQLRPFAIDMWPAAILFDGQGRILWVNTLSGSPGSIRGFERGLENYAPLPPAA